MSRNVNVILALIVLAAAASAAFLLLGPAPHEGRVARITLDGELVEEIDLDALEAPRTLVAEGPGGFSNTIEAQPGRIRVAQAGCPDQVCVNQGYIDHGAVPIVCLPNRLIIEIVGGGEDLDAATG